MTTIHDFILANQVTMTVKRYYDNPHVDQERGVIMDHWRILLQIGKHRFTTFYSMETAGVAPKISNILDYLAKEAASVEDSNFEEWCSEEGFDDDSRKAEAMYKACQRSAVQLEKLLGEDSYKILLHETERL